MAQLTTSWQNIASAEWVLSGYNTKVTFYLDAKYSSQNYGTNKTEIQTRLTSVLNQGSASGSGYNFTCSYAPTVSGSDVWNFETETITSGSATIEHNPDGTKSLTLSASASNSYWGMSKNLSATVDLPRIPRYATATTNISNIKETSANVNWSTDVAVDAIRYRINNGDWIIVEQDINKTSGMYMIPSLVAGTPYTIDFDYKRKDSQQWSFDAGYSSSETITTLDYITYIKVSNAWKKAIPYIKVNNAWKKAIPYINVNDTWKEGIN